MTASFSFMFASFSCTAPRSSSVVFTSSCVFSSSAAIVASFSSRASRSSPTRRSSVVAFSSEACFCFCRAESFARFALTELRISSISAFSSSRFCAAAVLPSWATAIEVLTALSSLTRRSSRLLCTSSSVDCISAVVAARPLGGRGAGRAQLPLGPLLFLGERLVLRLELLDLLFVAAQERERDERQGGNASEPESFLHDRSSSECPPPRNPRATGAEGARQRRQARPWMYWVRYSTF